MPLLGFNHLNIRTPEFQRDSTGTMHRVLPYDVECGRRLQGPLFISNPIDPSWRNIEFNMPVKLNLVDCEDRAGSFRLPVIGRA